MSELATAVRWVAGPHGAVLSQGEMEALQDAADELERLEGLFQEVAELVFGVPEPWPDWHRRIAWRVNQRHDRPARGETGRG